MKYEKEKSDQVAVSARKPYRTPKLTVHGTAAKITAAAGGCDDNQGNHFGKPNPGGHDNHCTSGS